MLPEWVNAQNHGDGLQQATANFVKRTMRCIGGAWQPDGIIEQF